MQGFAFNSSWASHWLTRILAAQEALFLTGCAFILPSHFYRLYDHGAGVLLVSDTPEVRQMIADEDAREEQINRFWREPHSAEERKERIRQMIHNPNEFPSGRQNFLAAMARAPGIVVPTRSYCEVIERSKSKCADSPIATAVYEKVRITTGRERGQQGWICETDVHSNFP